MPGLPVLIGVSLVLNASERCSGVCITQDLWPSCKSLSAGGESVLHALSVKISEQVSYGKDACHSRLGDAQRTSDLVRDAIAYVRDNHPYWNASGGADHFMVFSYDHGKCEMAKALHFEEFGKMFSVQAYGSLVYRCN